METNNLKYMEQLIIAVMSQKRRSMTSKQIVKELEKRGIKISRPTITKHLKNLKKKGLIIQKKE